MDAPGLGEPLGLCVDRRQFADAQPVLPPAALADLGKFAKAIAITSPRERKSDFGYATEQWAHAKAEAFPLWLKIAKERPVSYLNFANQLAAAARFEGLAEKPRIPVLLLNSLGDRLVEPSCSESLRQAWDCPMDRHPWGGHELHLG